MRIARNARIRGIALQVGLVGAILGAVLLLALTTVANLRARGIPLGFAFLNAPSGVPIAESLIRYSLHSTYARALPVGLVNSLVVSVLVILLASLPGLFLGIARLSGNPAVAALARGWAEIARNTPLLVLLLFVYGPSSPRPLRRRRGRSLPCGSPACCVPRSNCARVKPYFGTPLNAALSGLVLLALAAMVPGLLRWAVLEAAFLPAVPATCAAQGGACWSFVIAKSGQILFGIYPPAERWRPALVCVLWAGRCGRAAGGRARPVCGWRTWRPLSGGWAAALAWPWCRARPGAGCRSR